MNLSNNIFISVLLLIIIFFVSSCTIEKRIYMSGHHIKWKNTNLKSPHSELATKNKFSKENKRKKKIKANKNQEIGAIHIEEPLVASNDNKFHFSERLSIKIKNDSVFPIVNSKASILPIDFKKIDLTENKVKENDKSWRNFILNLIVPGLGTFLNGQKWLGILQFLLFIGGIFATVWIFWNTYIQLVFPILISVFAYGWSFYSGYINYLPNNNEIVQNEIQSIKNDNKIETNDVSPEITSKPIEKKKSKLAESRKTYKEHNKLKKDTKDKNNKEISKYQKGKDQLINGGRIMIYTLAFSVIYYPIALTIFIAAWVLSVLLGAWITLETLLLLGGILLYLPLLPLIFGAIISIIGLVKMIRWGRTSEEEKNN